MNNEKLTGKVSFFFLWNVWHFLFSLDLLKGKNYSVFTYDMAKNVNMN